MMKRLLFLAGLCVAAPASAQQSASLDSLVSHWLHRGVFAGWQPVNLFAGCPEVTEPQRRGIDRLLNETLSPERERHLVINWGIALDGCSDTRVENWLFSKMNQAMERGEHPWSMLHFWGALQKADSPEVRGYLRALMLDTAKSGTYRDHAGAALFARFGPEERMREYLAAFETRRLPFEMQVGQTTLLLERQPERLLREVGTRVRQNPDLAEQGAFTLLVESAHRYATLRSRRTLAQQIAAGLQRHPKSGRQLERLESAMVHLVERCASSGCP